MVGKALFQFVQLTVLARLLAPVDFGLMAMVLAVVAFIQPFSDLGVSSAIIHHQEISHNQLSSLYWLNVSIGLSLTLALAAGSYSISAFIFRQPAMQPLLVLISGSILLAAVGQQLRVMAEKSLRFAILAKIELVASLAGSVTAVGWAWQAPGVNALVAGLLVSSFLQTCLLWLFTSGGWWPKFRLRLGEIRHFLKFGGYMMANNLINSFNSQVDLLLGARLFPAATLGIYSLPRSLSLTVAGVVNPVITRVGLPMMAKAQNDKLFLKSVYLKTMQMTASVNFPIYIALAVFSDDVVSLVFGSQWMGSAPLLVFLSIWGMLRSCGNPVGSLLMATGRAGLSFKWNLAMLLIVSPALWIGSHWGITGVAIGQAVVTGGLMTPAWYFLVRPTCGAQGLEYALALLSPLVSALLAVGIACITTLALPTPLSRLAGAMLVALPVYLIASLMFNRGWLLAMRDLFTSR